MALEIRGAHFLIRSAQLVQGTRLDALGPWQTVYSPWWCLGQLSLPSLRGQ